MPAVPSCIIDPIRDQFLALLPEREDHHPLGCHNPRIPDQVVFDYLVSKLVSGLGYERVADAQISATTLRRRRDEWIATGVMEQLRLLVLEVYDRMIGLELEKLSVDGCITKAPAGGECAGKSPVDRAKQGTKRSQCTDGYGIPITTLPAPANTADHTLLPDTVDALKAIGPLPEDLTLHLDAGYDNQPTRTELDQRNLTAKISRKGVPAPVQVGRRWVVERTNSWMNNFGLLRRCTERRKTCVEFYLALAAIIVTVRSLIRRAWCSYRWDTRPANPRIR